MSTLVSVALVGSLMMAALRMCLRIFLVSIAIANNCNGEVLPKSSFHWPNTSFNWTQYYRLPQSSYNWTQSTYKWPQTPVNWPQKPYNLTQSSYNFTSYNWVKRSGRYGRDNVAINTTNPDYWTVTWPNGTTIRFDLTETASPKSKQSVDCFGLGSMVARFLTWWFKDDDDHANMLDVKFFLSSRKKPNRVRVFTGHQFGLEWTDFVAERRTVFIVHGFLSGGHETWVKEMEEALLMLDDVNVVVVDWAARGNTINYYKAAVNTRTVGNEIARFLHQVVNATIEASAPFKPRWGPLHLIGHSLGAHICGVAADQFKKRQDSWAVSRITGLDPAQPCFRNISLSLQLDRSDAPFVDIIHTNGRLMTSLGLGLPNPIGHVDFYPNGGKRQPGCRRINKTSYLDYLPIPKPMVEQAICSHGRSYLYLTETIVAAAAKNCTFWAHHWDQSYRRAVQIMSETCNANNCTEMGIKAENYPQRGVFFAITSGSAPFCDLDTQDHEEVRRQLRADYKHEIDD